MAFTYQSGKEIKAGDRVLFHGKPGRIGMVAAGLSGDPENDWHVREFGGGVMILDRVAGRTFIPLAQIADCEDLELVARGKL